MSFEVHRIVQWPRVSMFPRGTGLRSERLADGEDEQVGPAAAEETRAGEAAVRDFVIQARCPSATDEGAELAREDYRWRSCC